jgi:hypothetical protein
MWTRVLSSSASLSLAAPSYPNGVRFLSPLPLLLFRPSPVPSPPLPGPPLPLFSPLSPPPCPPGTLFGPLHLLAHRTTCRWSGVNGRAVVRLLSSHPTIPAAEVAARWDEWGGTPLTWLLGHTSYVPSPAVLAPLLVGLRRALGPAPKAHPAAGEAGAAGSGSEVLQAGPGTPEEGSDVFRDALYGVARCGARRGEGQAGW